MVLGLAVYSQNILNKALKCDLVLAHLVIFYVYFYVFFYEFYVLFFNVFSWYGKYCGKQIIY